MKTILGIDYGRKKIGLAIADLDSKLAEPYGILRPKDLKDVVKRLSSILKKNEVSKIILGISEGKMAEETKEFARLLRKKFRIPVVHQDETLTTYKAKELSKEVKISWQKLKKMEDSYSACIILQEYLDKK